MTYPIPDAALHESVAFIGRTGSGKSYAAKGGVERLLTMGARVCIIDPTGVHWGLRSSADGKSDGFPVAVFGGMHADMPIESDAGHALAGVIATRNVPAIVDVSEFTRAERIRFATAFFETLARSNRDPLHLIVDEADLFAPQRAMPDETHLLNRVEQIARRGRVRGFIPWLITQRPAELHKSVLSQASTLVAMRLVAPQDRKALGDWIEGQAEPADGKRVLADLPTLGKGEGYVWAPARGVLERVKFPPITTYDSGRTPEHGKTAAPVKLADVDLAALSETLREAKAEAAANDPKALRARIAELEKQVAGDIDSHVAEAYDRGHAAGMRSAEAEFREHWQKVRDTITHALVTPPSVLGKAGWLDEDAERESAGLSIAVAMSEPALREKIAPAVREAVGRAVHTAVVGLPEGERKILTAIAQHPHGCTREQLTVLTGYKKSTRDAYVLRLRNRGYVEADTLEPTAAGLAALGKFERLPTGRALLEHWLDRLPVGEAVILRRVASAPKRVVARDEITEYKKSSRDAYILRLRTRQLIVSVNGGAIALSETLR